MQLTETQRAQKEQEAVRQIHAQGLPPEETLKALYRVSPAAAAAFAKSFDEQQSSAASLANTKATTAKTEQDNAAKRLDMIGGLAQAVKGLAPEQRQTAWVSGLQNLHTQGVDVSKFPPQVPADPDLDGLIGSVTSAKDQMIQAREAAQLTETNRHNVAGEADNAAQRTEANRHNVAGEQTATTQATETGRHNTATEKQAQAQLGETRRHNQADETQKAAAATPVEIAAGSKDFRLAQDLAYGKLTFNDFKSLYGRAAAQANLKTAIYDKARELNPQFNPAAFEMGFALAKNPKVQQQLASMDNVQEAVPDILKLSEAATRTGITKLNDYIIQGGFQLGNKKYSNLATARTAFADELSGALGFGGATDMSRQMGIDMTRPDLSPEAFRSQIQDVVLPFIQRKRDTLLKQMGVYGGSDFNPAAQKPMSDALIQRNMQANPKATRQQIIDALEAAGYQKAK